MMRDLDSILVSVGMPVYNGLPDLRRALDTLLAQTHRNLEFAISDNCSTDGTTELCLDYAARDPRVRYSRNETNIGGAANFERVLRLAQGEFFFWACHDDWWAPTFVAENLRVLLERPDCIASMARVRYVNGDHEVRMPFIERADWRALTGSMQANIRHYVANSGMNSRLFSVYRREVLLACMPTESYTAADNALTVRTLAHGNYGEVNQPLFFRGMAGESANLRKMLTADRSWPGRVLPLWKYSTQVWKMQHVRRDFGLMVSLLTVNCVFFGMLLATLAKSFIGRIFRR